VKAIEVVCPPRLRAPDSAGWAQRGEDRDAMKSNNKERM
jgi:hypothetical protein